jgi:hypothetical protein
MEQNASGPKERKLKRTKWEIQRQWTDKTVFYNLWSHFGFKNKEGNWRRNQKLTLLGT